MSFIPENESLDPISFFVLCLGRESGRVSSFARGIGLKEQFHFKFHHQLVKNNDEGSSKFSVVVKLIPEVTNSVVVSDDFRKLASEMVHRCIYVTDFCKSSNIVVRFKDIEEEEKVVKQCNYSYENTGTLNSDNPIFTKAGREAFAWLYDGVFPE